MGMLTNWFRTREQYADLREDYDALLENYRDLSRSCNAWQLRYYELYGTLQAARDERTAASHEPYRAFVDRLFVNKREGSDGLMHMAVGLSGEAGELLDQVKKVWVYNKPLDRENMVEELGDAFYYFTGLMILMGIELKDVIDANTAKLKKRYPNGYSDQAAIERKDKVA